MTASEIQRLQTYLRGLFKSDLIRIVAPERRGASTELAVNDETIGTVHRDAEEGEVSYSIHLSVLEEDLPPETKPAPAAKTRTARAR